MQKELIQKNFEDFLKAVKLLKDSVRKYIPYDPQRKYTSEEMEFYDAMSFRFEKVIEVALALFRSLEIYFFGDSSDTLRIRLLRLEKAGFISSAEFWISARLMRNKIAHAYLPEELAEIYENIIDFSKTIFKEADKLEKKIKNSI